MQQPTLNKRTPIINNRREMLNTWITMSKRLRSLADGQMASTAPQHILGRCIIWCAMPAAPTAKQIQSMEKRPANYATPTAGYCQLDRLPLSIVENKKKATTTSYAGITCLTDQWGWYKCVCWETWLQCAYHWYEEQDIWLIRSRAISFYLILLLIRTIDDN